MRCILRVLECFVHVLCDVCQRAEAGTDQDRVSVTCSQYGLVQIVPQTMSCAYTILISAPLCLPARRLRDHEHNQHATRLEWIVIILIFVEVVVGLLELLGLFWFIKED